MNKIPVQTQSDEKEKVFLVIVDLGKFSGLWSSEDMLSEMEELVISCGGEVVDSLVVKLQKPSASTLISKGKLEEIAAMVSTHEIDTVIFSHDLKGSQQRNLEEVIKYKTIDRTQLILDIFAKHASSKEGKIQVELAQLEYLLLRLVGHGIELSRLGGGIGTLGPGETKLEIDRRRIATRITKLKRSLQEVNLNRSLTRKKRKDKGVATISLVGYTNAGKTTLLNALTNAKQVTHDGLFTTLDSLSRQLVLSNHQRIVVSDTVGFMHDLPHHLFESFKTTLAEVQEADVLLHVVDISHENFRNVIESVNSVLKELESFQKPTIIVFNKIDRVEDKNAVNHFMEGFKKSVCISALNKTNIDELLERVTEEVSSMISEINVNIPINRMDLVNLAHKIGEVLSVKYYNKYINIRATVPANSAGKFNNASL